MCYLVINQGLKTHLAFVTLHREQISPLWIQCGLFLELSLLPHHGYVFCGQIELRLQPGR